MAGEELTKLQREFARFYVEYLSPSKAYRLSHGHIKCSTQDDALRGQQFLSHPKVYHYIETLKAAEAERYKASISSILKDWIEIAKADASLVSTVRRINCRFCNGVDHKYQWKTDEEWATAFAKAMQHNDDPNNHRDRVELPDSVGGWGFDHTISPHPDCPECRGEGIAETWIADMSKLTGPEKKLFRGVKQTKNGIEVLLADQDKARDSIARHFGMFVDVTQLQLTGAVATVDASPTDPAEASKVYQRIMEGKALIPLTVPPAT